MAISVKSSLKRPQQFGMALGSDFNSASEKEWWNEILNFTLLFSLLPLSANDGPAAIAAAKNCPVSLKYYYLMFAATQRECLWIYPRVPASSFMPQRDCSGVPVPNYLYRAIHLSPLCICWAFISCSALPETCPTATTAAAPCSTWWTALCKLAL